MRNLREHGIAEPFGSLETRRQRKCPAPVYQTSNSGRFNSWVYQANRVLRQSRSGNGTVHLIISSCQSVTSSPCGSGRENPPFPTRRFWDEEQVSNAPQKTMRHAICDLRQFCSPSALSPARPAALAGTPDRELGNGRIALGSFGPSFRPN